MGAVAGGRALVGAGATAGWPRRLWGSGKRAGPLTGRPPPPAAGDPDGSPAKEWWGLAEVVEVMRERYCGTLAVEYKSLFQQVGVLGVAGRKQ